MWALVQVCFVDRRGVDPLIGWVPYALWSLGIGCIGGVIVAGFELEQQ